jgi:nicotinate-nucleotide pyrophosphorylase (carboxylating)
VSDVAADAARLAKLALAEDGPLDLTTEVTVPPGAQGWARIEFREPGVFAGSVYADAVARAAGLGPIEWQAADGDRLEAAAVVGRLAGNVRWLLRAERPLLNLLQRASGIATLTRRFVDAVRGTPARILHTRKTAPGLRLLDVTGVLAGGGCEHRLDLTRIVMVKDNHWRALRTSRRSLADALAEARRRGAISCYVEVETLEQVEEACRAGANRLLVDNQPAETLRWWAERARRLAPGIEIEATGGITLANVRSYAEAGADWISVGALTHSVAAADISLEVEEGG